MLGPWPAIYRLAVLSRLGAPRSALLEAQRAAADAYSHWTKTTHLYGDGTSERDPRLQEDVFALLYLATLVLPENVSLPGRLTLPGGTETVNLARTAAQILVLLLAGVRGNERLVSTVFGDGEAGSQPNTAFRQAKFRLTRLFGKFREAPELIVADERGALRLGAGIGLVAVCSQDALERQKAGESVTSR